MLDIQFRGTRRLDKLKHSNIYSYDRSQILSLAIVRSYSNIRIAILDFTSTTAFRSIVKLGVGQSSI